LRVGCIRQRRLTLFLAANSFAEFCKRSNNQNIYFMAPFLALGALLGIAILALFPDPRLLPLTALLPEKTALFFLGALFLAALWPSLHRKLSENRDAATFALLCAFFILFHIADRAGPREGFRCGFPSCPMMPFRFPMRCASQL
jgi:peptidoglycan/LPS O-acetylase OafA/YrhL